MYNPKILKIKKNSLNEFVYFISEIGMHRHRNVFYILSRKRLTNQYFCTENNWTILPLALKSSREPSSYLNAEAAY